MPHEPVGCQADRLFSVSDIADHIRSQERQLDHLLYAPFRDTLRVSNLAEGFAGTDHIEIPMRTPDVAQQGFIDFQRFIADDELGFDPAFTMLEWGRDFQEIIDNAGLIQVQSAGEMSGRDGNTECAGRYVDTIDERQIDIVSIIRCAGLQRPQ